MSINNEISNYQTYLTNAYTKCADKNATIPANKNLQNLTSCIDSIPNHIKLTYIESTGTQYIDTGFKPNNNSRVICEFTTPSSLSDWVFTFGARVGYQNADFSFAVNSSQWHSGYGNQSKRTTSPAIATNTRYIVDKNKATYTINTTSATNTSATFETNNNMIIFGCNTNGTNTLCSMKLYYCKIYNNGTLIRDYIPVLYYGIPCLFDKVEKKYYFNQGTGTFTAGDAVLDYIESTGTQWINSNVISKVGTTVKMDLMLTQIPSSNAYFYGNTYSNSLMVGLVFYYSSDILRWGLRRNTYVGYSTGGGTNSPQANVKYNIEAYWNANAQRLYVNGASRVSTTTALTDSGSRALILFGNSQAAVSQLKMRLYDCQIYQNDVLVADFIPVLKADTGEPCLYDRTRNVYKLNSGSGTFLFG